MSKRNHQSTSGSNPQSHVYLMAVLHHRQHQDAWRAVGLLEDYFCQGFHADYQLWPCFSTIKGEVRTSALHQRRKLLAYSHSSQKNARLPASIRTDPKVTTPRSLQPRPFLRFLLSASILTTALDENLTRSARSAPQPSLYKCRTFAIGSSLLNQHKSGFKRPILNLTDRRGATKRAFGQHGNQGNNKEMPRISEEFQVLRQNHTHMGRISNNVHQGLRWPPRWPLK